MIAPETHELWCSICGAHGPLEREMIRPDGSNLGMPKLCPSCCHLGTVGVRTKGSCDLQGCECLSAS